MYEPKSPFDVIRAIDEIFANAGIYGPLLREIEKGKFAGDVSENEFLYFKWNNGLVGISFDEHVFDTLDQLAKEVKSIHNEFKNKHVRIIDDYIISPDKIIMLDDY